MEDAELTHLAHRTGTELTARRLVLATAESCTGGWIAKLATDIPGSSQWFECGCVTYSNAAKTAMLGVESALIEAHGAVSRPVVEAMASGVLARSGASVAVAVSGIAGPSGGTQEKPVGTVWIAWAGANARHESSCLHFEGNREVVRRASVAAALEGIIERVTKDFFRPLAG